MRTDFALKLTMVFAFALAGIANARLAAAADPALVKIDSGSIRGVVENGVISFKGIPYAKPPIGTLRWRKPQPVGDWRGVRDAAKFGPECMQTEPYRSRKIASRSMSGGRLTRPARCP